MSLKLNSSGGGSVLIQEPSTASNVTFTLPSETATAVYANASGNVGIGTSSPDSLSNFRFIDVGSSGTNQGVIQANNGTVKTAIYVNGTDGVLATRTNHNLSFQTNATTQAAITTAGNFQFNSGYGSVATAYGCRAWATFNGTASPATLNASGGITSMTKNSTGNYTVNFSFTFPDANYAAYFGIAGGGGGGNASFVGCVVTTTQYGAPTNKTTTVCQIQTNDYTATPRDFTQAYVAFFR